jgi:hypothetical protein
MIIKNNKKWLFHNYLTTGSFIFFIIFETIGTYLYTGIPSDKPMIILQWLRDIFLAIGLASLVIFGIRDLRIYDKTLKRFISPLIGIVTMILLFYFIYMLENKIRSFNNLQIDTKKHLEHIKQEMEKENISLSEKEEWHKTYAEMYYMVFGKSIKYLKEGKYILYEPSRIQLKANQNKIENEKSLQYLSNAKYLWLMLLVFSLLVGLLTPINKQIYKVETL